jgi:hypothetical protein
LIFISVVLGLSCSAIRPLLQSGMFIKMVVRRRYHVNIS